MTEDPIFHRKTRQQIKSKNKTIGLKKAREIYSNPLFKPVRKFKKSLIEKSKVQSYHSGASGTSIYDIHPEFDLKSKVLNSLSKQNNINIHPYLEALEELYDTNDKYDQQQTKNIQQLCYIGVGKGLVEQKMINLPSYSRVNLLIRQFMIDPIERDILQSIKKQNPDHIFIDTNDKGLGFKTILPSQYYDFLPVIIKCNKIITGEYLQFKRKKQPKIAPLVNISTWVKALGVILMALSLLLFQTSNYAVMIVGLVFVLFGVLFNFTYFLVIQQKSTHHDSNVIDQIQKKIQHFLQQINNQQMKDRYKWICGKDFYWLQVIPLT